MIRLLFVLGAAVTFVYGTWTLALSGSNTRVVSQQTDFLRGTGDKPLGVGSSDHRDRKRSDSSAESMGNRSIDLTDYHDAGLVALRREVSRLKADVDALRHGVKTLLERDRLAITEHDFYADEEKPLEILQAEELATRAESEWQMRQYMNSVEERFQSESDYAGWSFQATELIERELQSGMFSETSLVSLECRSSLCRLEVQHEDLQASSAFANNFPEKVAEMFSKFSIDHIDEEESYSSMIIYLMQEEPG